MYAYSSPSSSSRSPRRLRSLGDVTNTQIAATAGTVASSTAGVLVALGVAVPVVGPIVAGIAAIGVLITQLFSGCGQTCVQASNLANQAEQLLKQAFSSYMSAGVHTESARQAYLSLFDQTWAQLQQYCGNPQLAQAGMRCISDRQRGACTWKASPGGWSQGANGQWTYTNYGAAGSGTTCWDWFVGYRDPVADDPTVVPDSNPVTQAESGISSLLNGSTFDWSTLLIPAGLLAVVLWAVE
jgi:hypothetical protein